MSDENNQAPFTEAQIFPNKNLEPSGDEPPPEIPGPSVPEVYMVGFTRYDPIMGRILFWGNCTNVELEIHRQIGAVLEGRFSGQEYYVDTAGPEPVAALRPAMAIPNTTFTVVANGHSELVITGLPAMTAVGLSGPIGITGVSTTGNVTLVFSIPGEYSIEFESFPYLETSRKIYAT